MNEQEQMDFFYEIFDASLPRLGPGDDASTRRAISALLSSRERLGGGATASGELRILDLGCGNGTPTIQLAKHAGGTILAIDNHQPFLDELTRRSHAEGVAGKIKVQLGDMRKLELPEGSFDLIWSEGALFVTGFKEGLEAWRLLLAPGGMMAVSELAWFRPNPPEECRQFFANCYPPMAGVDANLAAIKACGYTVLEHFSLPKSSWLENYFAPIEGRLRSLRVKYAADAEKIEMIESLMQKEIDIYHKYSDYYGYEFFLMNR